MPSFIGIDPGKKGAIAFVDDDDFPYVEDTPLLGDGAYDIPRMVELVRFLLRDLEPSQVTVTIESQWSRPRHGGVGSFTNGFGYGLWMGILHAEGYVPIAVPPNVWKEAVGVTADKSTSIALARRLYPLAALIPEKRRYTRPRDGRAEALLIMMYGRQHQETLCRTTS